MRQNITNNTKRETRTAVKDDSFEVILLAYKILINKILISDYSKDYSRPVLNLFIFLRIIYKLQHCLKIYSNSVNIVFA